MQKNDFVLFEIAESKGKRTEQLAKSAFDALDELVESVAVKNSNGELVVPSCSFVVRKANESNKKQSVDSYVGLRGSVSAIKRRSRLTVWACRGVCMNPFYSSADRLKTYQEMNMLKISEGPLSENKPSKKQRKIREAIDVRAAIEAIEARIELTKGLQK